VRSRTIRTIGSQPRRASTRSRLVAAAACAVPALALFGAANANAYEISNFTADVYQADGTTPVTQAGAHPYQGIIAFTTAPTATDNVAGEPDAYTETIRTDTPAGLVPNPEATDKCTQAQLESQPVSCPPTSQIGQVQLRLRTYIAPPSQAQPAGVRGTVRLTLPLYNMEREDDSQLARFSFNPAQAGQNGHIVDIVGGARDDGDYGLFFTISHVARPESPATAATPSLTGSKLVFWGTPSSADHAVDRGRIGLDLLAQGGTVLPNPPSLLPPGGAGGNQVVPDTGEKFLTNPTSCTGPVTARLTLDTYAAGESYPPAPAAGSGLTRTRDYTIGADTNGATGCDQVPFASRTSFGPSSMQNDAPVPLSVMLDVDQDLNPDIGTAHVKDVSVTLPPGMTISPSAANGLEGCTDAQFGAGTKNAIACPASSRVGAVRITSPVLDNVLTGSVYIGQPLGGDRYRLFVNADAPGISIRLKGTVLPNQETGQITAVFKNNPQLPFSQFKLDFDGGSKAIIASAQTCGTTEGSGTLAPWSGNASSRSVANVSTTGCNGNPFEPTFAATSSSTLAGKYTPLGVLFGRRDGNQFLSGLSATLPRGMTAKIKGVRQCNEAQVATIACPADSRIGTVSVSAGPGDAPYSLSGPAYLTGSYKGGAFGSVAVIHVTAGPYDLGYITVRQALRVDPETAQVTVDSDPLPQIKEGIVLRLRALRLDVDRKDFLRNPTSCGPAAIQASLTGAAGGKATPTATQTFTDCQKLAFRPKIAVAFGVKSQMKKGRNPSVTVTATQRESEAGIRSTQVALPKDVSLKAANAEKLCTQVQLKADKCPKESIVGSAKATTTILNRPVSGPVYFVEGQRTTASGKVVKTLPALYIPLTGEARINVHAQTSVSGGRLVTTLPAIPDAPITKFALKINGGKRGIINANRDLCQRSVKAAARFVSWNGKSAPRRTPTISRSVCK
jgi:hypothetical protein